MKKGVQPIFIISLPRSGSTLLQRLLMSNDSISSVAEPHFLLPFVYAMRDEGTIAEYSHLASVRGVTDIISNMHGKEKEYFSYLKSFSLNIYKSLSSGNSIYFIDKTPRYFWILEELNQIFPDSKFIFLFRDPIQIYASFLQTFSKNKRFNKMYRSDLYFESGFDKLSFGYEKMKEKSIAIHYEDLLKDTNKELGKIFDYLNLEMDINDSINFFKQKIKGRSADQTGQKEYSSISSTPLNKWKTIFNTKFRKRHLINFVSKISDESLRIQGYSKETLLQNIRKLDTIGNYSPVVDFIDISKNRLIKKFKLNLFFDSKMSWTRNNYLN